MDLYLTLTPVLVAIPVVVVMLRLYPLAVRGLLATSTRRAGATGFVALSRAARSSLTGVLPAFALVLALSLATFAGMVNAGIARGELAASWHTTGADVLIEPGPYSPPVSSAGGAGDRRGPRRASAAGVWSTNWVTPFGQPIRWSRWTRPVTPPWSRARRSRRSRRPRSAPRRAGTVPFGGTVPVLASPSAAALLGTGATQLTR